MKLNPDCIRDILIAVENGTDSEHGLFFSSTEIPPLMDKYDYNTLLYHIRQCSKANLIESPRYYDNGDSGLIPDLSPKRHEFLANIRENNIWNGVKAISEKAGSASLDAITQIASNVITELIKAQFGLIS